MCTAIHPTFICVRSSGSKEGVATKKIVMAGLVENGFITLEVNDLIQLEVAR